jgi:hypothetical protein
MDLNNFTEKSREALKMGRKSWLREFLDRRMESARGKATAADRCYPNLLRLKSV